jgi:RimJ/RimL family protein N-acetyltransferase
MASSGDPVGDERGELTLIFGEGIRLRGAERSDLPQFVSWLNDPDVIQNLVIYAPLSMADEESWFEGLRARPVDERPLVIEAQQNGDWVMIGNCGFHNIDWRCRSAEVGIFIGNKSYWNQGYGTQVMKLLVQHGFETLNLNRIMLDVYETNPRAIRAYQKAGFVHEGRKRQANYQNGEYCDVLIMSILRQEWESGDA